MSISPNSQSSSKSSGDEDPCCDEPFTSLPWKELTDHFQRHLTSAAFVGGIETDLRLMEDKLAKFARPCTQQGRRFN